MAFEFKKLSDVNSIEAMKEGLNILAEDNGEIVKVQTPYYGITIQFIDGSALVPGMLTYQESYTMTEIVNRLRNAVNEKVEFIRLNLKTDGSSTTLYQTGFEFINLGDGNYNAKVYFGEGVCPVILDTVENKMIFDPDWTAPTESIPVPATAEVGQVVAVKAVDENGKPTEWEAVNADEPVKLHWEGADGNEPVPVCDLSYDDFTTAMQNGRKLICEWYDSGALKMRSPGILIDAVYGVGAESGWLIEGGSNEYLKLVAHYKADGTLEMYQA